MSEVKIYLHTLPLGGFVRVVTESDYLHLRAENLRLKETLSYLPKVPTQPYEKEMAKEILRLREGATQCISYMRHHGQMIDQQVVSVLEAQFALEGK
jgi:type II secretory pathway component PulF